MNVPPVLHHYRVERPLAEGGMGQVFLGFDVALERPVALKVIQPEMAAQAGFSQRFVREARAQAGVSHSNVVQVYFVGQTEGVWFMAMELMDGGCLEDLLVRHEKMAWGDAVRHLEGLAEGLREAARLGILHRDIKPANILLDRFGLAHLADFGLALPVGAQDGNVIFGSPGYMSPEQARGEVLDVRSDLYALGATFYELLSATAPVSAKTIPEAQRFHRQTRPRPLREVAPQVPRGLARIVDRCLAPRPEDRFADYDALLTAVRAAAPRPLVPARAPQRLLAWGIDVAVAVGVARLTVQRLPLLAFIVLALWFCGGAFWLGATPGQWLMRVQLRTPADTEAAPLQLVGRLLLQHGWLLPALLGVARVYGSDAGPVTQALMGLAALWFLAVTLGSLPALWGRRGWALHDRLSGTRVLLDIR